MPRRASRSRPASYTSSTIEVSRRMNAPGPHHEERAIIYDLMTRAGTLESTLSYYDRTTGKGIADEAAAHRAKAQRYIDRLPAGDLRALLTRKNLERST